MCMAERVINKFSSINLMASHIPRSYICFKAKTVYFIDKQVPVFNFNDQQKLTEKKRNWKLKSKVRN